MHLKHSKKVPFTCLILIGERGKEKYEIVPVYAESYQRSIQAARQQVADWRDRLVFYVIAADGNVTIDGGSSDAIVVEACEVAQGAQFQFARRYTPPGFFSKARAEKDISLIGCEPLGSPAA
ncbi:MAG TPA: hypothetical protein VMV72_04735 [Verrucomicrobiae bacterium]|nr:hypothetical protein [Verrucomicrobiae bacterium]